MWIWLISWRRSNFVVQQRLIFIFINPKIFYIQLYIGTNLHRFCLSPSATLRIRIRQFQFRDYLAATTLSYVVQSRVIGAEGRAGRGGGGPGAGLPVATTPRGPALVHRGARLHSPVLQLGRLYADQTPQDIPLLLQ